MTKKQALEETTADKVQVVGEAVETPLITPSLIRAKARYRVVANKKIYLPGEWIELSQSDYQHLLARNAVVKG